MEFQQLNSLEGTMLLINKPLGWTSFDIVKKLRNTFKINKIGHAGTLDPLATGLLIICTGKKTKTISHYQELNKVYTGQLVLGKTTPSIDLETPFDSLASYDHVTETAIYELAKAFTGYITQIPPAYSAIKSKGVRAYKKAREGSQLVLQPREVVINSFTITAIDLPSINFEITCSKGTYIRSIVRDFGEKLKTGAYLSGLCRTHIGPYSLNAAYEIENLTKFEDSSLKIL
jgi:tRNA pseudouridine55 synthase